VEQCLEEEQLRQDEIRQAEERLVLFVSIYDGVEWNIIYNWDQKDT
jgi:hypothetical protein